jgi:hypothetical protein
MNTTEFFLLHHNSIYFEASGILKRINGLSDEQLRLCQHNLNSIAWILWHIARCEDLAINRIIIEGEQILDTDNFACRLNLSRRDIGTSMSFNEVINLSNQIDINSLRNYITAVATKTQKVMREFPLDQLNQILDPANLRKVLFDEGALNTNSKWVAGNYSERTKGWFLGHLALTHPRGHLGQIILLRKLIGLGSGE